MNSINNINFRGGETAGSISKLAPAGNEQMSKFLLRNQGTEVLAPTPKLAPALTADTVNFCGGGETVGSISNRKEPVECPTCGNVSFQGYDNEEKKGMSALGVVGVLTAVAATGVLALAYGHKKEVFKDLGDGKLNDLLKKLGPAAETCHKWCSTAKTKCLECWEKITGFFKSKKN